jgi:CHAT domain-containing protein/tetratricopeptide (TPR) repeat protein
VSGISLTELVAAVSSGAMSGEQAMSTVQNAAPDYSRALSDSGRMRSADVAGYLDRLDRAGELAQEINDILRSVNTLATDDTSLLMPLGDVVAEATGLIGSGPFRAYFRFGYEAWEREDYPTSAYLLQRACEARADEDGFARCAALCYLCDALLSLRRYDETLRWLDIFASEAAAQDLRGYLSLAYRDFSLVKEARGRTDEAFADIRKGIALRQSLSGQEIREQSVITEAEFRVTEGLIARKLGLTDDAIGAFQHAYEQYLDRQELRLAATALSDIGFTYHRAGDTPSAVRYLRRAASLAESCGAHQLARHWLAAARPETAEVFAPAEGDQTADEAYARSSAVSAALDRRQTAGAPSELRWLINWAQRHDDADLELTCRANLANLYDIDGDLFQAILKDRSAALVALRTGNLMAWLTIQANLVNRCSRHGDMGRNQARRVAGEAINQIEHLLRTVSSTESRQLIQAGAQRLYESMVLLAMAANDDEEVLATAERARGRNTAGWISADILIRNLELPAPERQRLLELLSKSRGLDTALEEHMLIGQLSAQQLENLRQARGSVRQSMANVLVGNPDASDALERALGGEQRPLAESMRALATDSDSAVLYLFGLSEGVAALVLRSGDTKPRKGTFAEWPREERLKVLNDWMNDSSGRPDQSGARRVNLTRFVEQLHVDFFARLVRLFDGEWPAKLAIVPHRELRLIPFHELVLPVAPQACVTIAPSLHVLARCLMRRPSQQGSTVLIRDKTRTLPCADKEADLIRRVRSTRPVIEPSSITELRSALPDADLFVCAAHGTFNADNPYRSGLLAFSADLRGRPDLDVAEVLSAIRLPDCGLVMLSACESGLSRLHAADENTGLPAAFLVAGAKTVIATKWPVRDDAALLMTDEFMRHWQGGTGNEPSAAQALHQARAAIRAMPVTEAAARLGQGAAMTASLLEDPIYTAPFEVHGAW